MTERLHFHFSLSCIGEGNGNPLQCSCLENPRDRGVWWAAIYGVAQSRTRVKRLSSSSSRPVSFPLCVQIQTLYATNASTLCAYKIQPTVPAGMEWKKNKEEKCSKNYLATFTKGASLVAQRVKNLPAMKDTQVRSLDWEGPLEKGKATHSSILASKIL